MAAVIGQHSVGRVYAASAAIAQWRAVVRSGAGTVAAAGANAEGVLGVTMDAVADANPDNDVTVIVGGLVTVKLGAAAQAGQLLGTLAGGEFSPASANKVVKALVDGVDNQEIPAILI